MAQQLIPSQLTAAAAYGNVAYVTPPRDSSIGSSGGAPTLLSPPPEPLSPLPQQLRTATPAPLRPVTTTVTSAQMAPAQVITTTIGTALPASQLRATTLPTKLSEPVAPSSAPVLAVPGAALAAPTVIAATTPPLVATTLPAQPTTAPSRLLVRPLDRGSGSGGAVAAAAAQGLLAPPRVVIPEPPPTLAASQDARIRQLFDASDANRDGVLDWNSGEVVAFSEAVLAEFRGGQASQALLYGFYDDVDRNLDARMDLQEGLQFARKILRRFAAAGLKDVPNAPATLRAYSRAVVKPVGIFFEVVEGAGAADASSKGFPHSLGPFDLHQTKTLQPADFAIVEGQTPALQWSLQLRALQSASPALQALGQVLQGAAIQGSMSPPHAACLPRAALAAVGFVDVPVQMAWSYPIGMDWDQLGEELLRTDDPDASFLRTGGFLFLTLDLTVVGVVAMQYAPEGLLRFGPPRQWLPQWTISHQSSRFRPMTLKMENGSPDCDHSWILPSDVPGICPFGGFAFLWRGVGGLDSSAEPAEAVEAESERRPSLETSAASNAQLVKRIQELELEKAEDLKNFQLFAAENEQLQQRCRELEEMRLQSDGLGGLQQRQAELEQENRELMQALSQSAQNSESVLFEELSKERAENNRLLALTQELESRLQMGGGGRSLGEEELLRRCRILEERERKMDAEINSLVAKQTAAENAMFLDPVDTSAQRQKKNKKASCC